MTTTITLAAYQSRTLGRGLAAVESSRPGDCAAAIDGYFTGRAVQTPSAGYLVSIPALVERHNGHVISHDADGRMSTCDTCGLLWPCETLIYRPGAEVYECSLCHNA